MTRIIAGRARGRRLKTPPGEGTRPTTDRVREALFSSIEASIGSLAGARFLDLYAGSGVVGLEAWSRGADAVTFIEHDRRAARVIGANATAIGCDGADVVASPVSAALRRGPGAQYDICFLDPPYALETSEVGAVLVDLVEHRWLAPDALVVVERSARAEPITWPRGVTHERERRYGETTLHYGWRERW